ncbi:type I-D CRISPR-associated protein Cas10d/Csc3, partial [Spirulina sp. 06S082]|uniref:type I-D CRISPR-associated protein Cas10d/Csc3 n=1 Tax=Spirulina sp. 06S082 TaxID=3110248 RepID=UPI002B221696
MKTILQTVLLETLPAETDPILRAYITTIVPAMEREFADLPALGGSEEIHKKILNDLGDPKAVEKSQRWAKKADQSLLVHVLNALLVGWNLTPFLNPALTDEEKYLFCLGITLHDYNKYCNGEGEDAPKAYEIEDILALCQQLGERLNFTEFWPEWSEYLTEIAYLAQNTQFKIGANPIPANWPPFKIESRRLQLPLRRLLAFGDIAVHIQDPGEIDISTTGKRLHEHLRFLGIRKRLIYHRLRDTLGILTNGIHNATLYFTRSLDWQPILYFAQGVVYLAPPQAELPKREELQTLIWQQISQLLSAKMLGGEIGFKRDGKGLKIAPQTLELFAPAQLIRGFSKVIDTKVGNLKNPATPKRLEKLGLSEEELQQLSRGADLRSDRLAELLFILQKEFFANSPEYIT